MYNSVDYDDTEMSTLCDQNVMIYMYTVFLTPLKINILICMTVEQVEFAINKFKTGKTDSTDGLLSDNFKKCTYL